MNIELLLGLALFALASSITPGPNNLMLMASGANYGVPRTLPHMAGVSLGFTLMVLLVGLGIVQLFDRYPASYTVLKVGSLLYLVFLAWKTGTAGGPTPGSESEDGTGKPITFLQAAGFQWVNPKAWTMALTAVSVYALDQTWQAVAVVAVVFGLINLPCIALWTYAGQQLRRLLNTPARITTFNVAMAVMLLASVVPVVFAGQG